MLPVTVCLLALSSTVYAEDWKPVEGKIMTRWAQQVTPKNAHSEYPRPMMVRRGWRNLNGLWDYAICPKDQEKPGDYDGKILVPYPIESALSGVKKAVGPDNRLWYKRTFLVPDRWDGKRVLLHFEAVDWDTAVRILNSGEVEMVVQLHSLVVTLTMKDGSQIRTLEPRIDAIFVEIEKCGSPCRQIILATE